MTWVKIDDGFMDHPKIEALPRDSVCLHLAGICFSARTLSDGFVPADRVRRLQDRVTRRMVNDLVRVGVWLEVDGGYQIKDYLEYNPSRAKVLTSRAAAAERQKRWKQTRDASRNASRNSVSNAVTNASPSRPDPSRRDKGRVSDEPSVPPPSPCPSDGAGLTLVESKDTSLPAELVAQNVTAIRELRKGLAT